MKIKGKYRLLWALLGAAALTGFTVAVLLWNGIIWFQNPSREEYPVRGIDVSHYQGEIDWSLIRGQNIQFAFIKATEGSSYVDPCFEQNLKGAAGAGIPVGVYHFFSFDSPPETQADNLFSQLPGPLDLPPVVDLEYYGDKEKHPPDAGDVQQNLGLFLSLLEEHYGRRPIVYTTMDCYDRYLRGKTEGFDLWIRNILRKPVLQPEDPWTFWQFSSRGRLKGFSGEEPFIDLNVFNGTEEEFADYLTESGS